MYTLNNKFIYQDQREFLLLKSQCEKCIHYNNGEYSKKKCPTENIDKIKTNKLGCPNRKNSSILDKGRAI